MPAQSSYEYAVIRVVPRVEREEFVNVGVILFCRVHKFLECRTHLDGDRISALFPEVDIDALKKHVDQITSICSGAKEGGPIAALPIHERFHWLVAPRSTILQTSATHSGMSDDPKQALENLFKRLIA